MTLQIRQLHPLFAGEVTGLDLRDLTDRKTIDVKGLRKLCAKNRREQMQ